MPRVPSLLTCALLCVLLASAARAQQCVEASDCPQTCETALCFENACFTGTARPQGASCSINSGPGECNGNGTCIAVTTTTTTTTTSTTTTLTTTTTTTTSTTTTTTSTVTTTTTTTTTTSTTSTTTTTTVTTTTSTSTTTAPGPVLSCVAVPTGTPCYAGADPRCAREGVCFSGQCTNSGPQEDGVPCASPGPDGVCLSGACDEGATAAPSTSVGQTTGPLVSTDPVTQPASSSPAPTTAFELLPTGAAEDTPGQGVVFVAADILLVDARPSVYLIRLAEFSIFAQELLERLQDASPGASIVGIRHVGAYPTLPQRLRFRVEVIGSAAAGEEVANSLRTVLRSASFLSALKAQFPVQSQALAQIVVDSPIAVVEPAVATTAAPAPSDDDDDDTPLLAIILGAVAGVLLVLGIAIIIIMQTTTSKEEVEFSKLASDLEGGRALPPVRRNSAFFTTALDEGDIADRLPAQPGTRQYYTGTPASALTWKELKENYIPVSHSQPPFDNFAAAKQPYNVDKNRYRDVLPYDRCRVRLRAYEAQPGSDYINASFVPGYLKRRAYISTQGPLAHTVKDFWRMVWEQHVSVIAVVTQFVEKGREKSYRYWPSARATEEYGTTHVTFEAERDAPSYTVRRFLVRDVASSAARRVTQVQFKLWPDHGAPEETSAYIEFHKAVQTFNQNLPGPILVHCSAGVGRSGSFIAIDTELNRFNNERCIMPFATVCNLRMARIYMVQTPEQYVFVHRVLLDYIASKDDGAAVGMPPAIGEFLTNFSPRGDYAGFDMGINGRRVAALGEAEGIRGALEEVPLQLLLCSDVLLVTATGGDGKHVLVRPPFPRQSLRVEERAEIWEEDVIELSDTVGKHGNINHDSPLLLAFASNTEMELWVRMLRSKGGVVPTSELTGARIITAGPRSAHELAILLDIADPHAKYGASELEKEYGTIPKVVLNTQVSEPTRVKHGQNELHLDEFGYLLKGSERLEVEPSTLAAIRKLSLQARFAETSGETAQDMLEIEYLMKIMELHDLEQQEQAYVRQAREAEVAAYIARQKAEIEAQLDAQEASVGRPGLMSSAQSEYPESEYTVYTDTESRYLEVESESEPQPAHVINDPVSEGFAPRYPRRRSTVDTGVVVASSPLQRHASRYHQSASIGARHSSLKEATGGVNAGKTSNTLDAARKASVSAGQGQSEAPFRRGSTSNRVGPLQPEVVTTPDGRRKKRVPVRTNVAGFSLAKGAAKRLTKNSAKRASQAEREAGNAASPQGNAGGLDIPCTYLGNCQCRSCVAER